MTESSDTAEEGSTATEKMDTVKGNAFMQPEVVGDMFVRTMAICPPIAHLESEMDLWENRATNEDDAINRAIILLQRDTPPTSSPL